MMKQDVKAISIVLPFRQNFMTLLDFPETLSRVILALLGSVFQTNLSDSRQVFKSARNRNIDQTENSVSYNIRHLENPQTSVCGKTPQRRKQKHGETLNNIVEFIELTLLYNKVYASIVCYSPNIICFF